MRMFQLFAFFIGFLPVFVFGATVWVTEGAPFRPFGPDTGSATAADTPTPAVPAGLPALPERLPPLGFEPARIVPKGDRSVAGLDRDDDWHRLHRLARDGDRGAVMLLSILDAPPRTGARTGSRAPR